MSAQHHHQAPEGDIPVAGRAGTAAGRLRYRQESLSVLTSEAAASNRPGVQIQRQDSCRGLPKVKY